MAAIRPFVLAAACLLAAEALRRAKEQANGSSEKIFLSVLVRTGGNASASRQESINQTWGRDLEENALNLLQPDDVCKSLYGENHWKGLTCLEAKNHVRLMDGEDFEWLLVVDDDAFVFADRLRATLRNMDPSKAEAYGTPNCGQCGNGHDGKRGFCGGGGYMISRQNLLKMGGVTEGPLTSEQGESFVAAMVAPPDAAWCDVRFGCVAQDVGLKLVAVHGLYSDGVIVHQTRGQALSGEPASPEEEAKFVAGTADQPMGAPLVLHNVRDHEHMKRLYDESLEERQRAEGTPTEYDESGTDGRQKWRY